jgi:hypothetical protein
MPQSQFETATLVSRPPVAPAFSAPFSDHLQAGTPRALQDDPVARVIEIGEVTAGIAVPERGGVRFFSSERTFDALDGAIFGSIEQAAKAARERFHAKARTSRLQAV